MGGTGADDLDGGVGVDYCKKDSSDTTTSCYFDTARPTMRSIAVGTTSVDTSAAARIVAVRVRLHDAGTGVASIDLTFGRHLTNGSWVNEFHFQTPTEGAEQQCTAAGHATNPTALGDTRVCLVAGTPRDGVYELRTLLPRWSPKGTYQLNDVRLRDSAGNTGGQYWEQLVDQRLAVNFKQTGAGDALSPLVRAIGTLTPSVSTAGASRTIGVRLHVTDATSGLAGLQVGWARVVRDELGSVSEYRWPQPQFGFTTDALPACADGIPTPAELFGGQRDWACRESGTLQDGWYRLYSVLPQWSGKGSYELVTLITSDRAGNSKVMGDGEIRARGLSRHIYQSGDGDESPAFVSAVTVMTPSVSTGDAGAEVVIRVRAKDAVSGIGGLFVDMAPADSTVRQGLSFSSGNEPCGPDTAYACLLSGTINDGVWQLKATLPAHAAAGTWKVVSVIANDRAGNTRQWWSSFGATLTNS